MWYFNYCHCCAGTFCHIITDDYLRAQYLSGCTRGILGHSIIRFVCEGQSGSISLQEAWMMASCFELISVGQQGLCWSGLEGCQWMATVFVVVNLLQVELCMEFAVVGVAGVSVAGETAVGCLTAWVAGADVDVVGATLSMLDVSGLTASRWHS